jgi:uncharacterized protein YkwD
MSFFRLLIIFSVVVLAGVFYLSKKSSQLSENSVILVEPAPLSYDDEKFQALNYLNDIREASGLIRLDQAPILETSAQNHAFYLISNEKVIHEELESDKAFTGVTPSDRAIHAGYNSAFVIENISFGNRNFKESVDNLFSAIYHRFAFLNFQVDEVGIGVFQDNAHRSKVTYVYNMGLSMFNGLCSQRSFNGNGKYVYGICADKMFRISEKHFNAAKGNIGLRSNTIVIYPFDGQKDVPPAFFDEIPDPLPNHLVSGFPISISFNDAYFKDIEIEAFELYDNDGQKVNNTTFYDHSSDPNGKFKKFEYALFPLERLEWNNRYSVKVTYISDGKKEEKRWSFHTTNFNEKLYTVTPDNYTFTVSKNISSIFYLKPFTQNDILENIQFPDYLHIRFIDQNTLRITATDEAPDTIELELGKHELKLNIE